MNHMGGLRALSEASTSRQETLTTPQSSEVLRLFWPASTVTDSSHIQGDEMFIRHVLSVIAGLGDHFGLPASNIKLAISAAVASRDSPRSNVASLVSSHCHASATVRGDAPQHALRTIARLWTMLDIQIEVPQYQPPGPLVWLPDEPITAPTKRFFAEKARHEQSLELSGTIDRDLTAARLVSDHGVRLMWTSNIAEHLSTNWTNKRIILKIFEYKAWAHRHLTSPETSPIPIDVLNELMGTYNILFPMFDNATDSLLARDGMVESFYSLGTRGNVPSKNWSDYKYWRKALYQLSEVLNEPPHGVRQFWRTSRKDPNLLNVVLFWISGVMVAILTIVSSVCGVMSVQYAVESRDIGLRQLELAIAQVCADTELASKLPQYCHSFS
ncbi:hypothetical protein QBC39DRAFT_353420 [Podospora conica]|nr:hypothetical protein QBC39DRAFT_353420 [Schizothecium conicum]